MTGIATRKLRDADHALAYSLTADARGNYDLRVVDAVAHALAAERDRATEAAIEAIRASWRDQCAGNQNMICESCRAYSDAILALGGQP